MSKEKEQILFALASGSEPPRKRLTSVFRSKTLAQGGFIPPEHVSEKGSPQNRRFCGAGKKKMRNLGTVQLPTEAFMAVLKLDE